QRLAQPVTHRRSVRFNKMVRFWLIEDELSGAGSHEAAVRFHLAPGIEPKLRPDGIVELWDKMSGARLLILCQKPEREEEQLSLHDPMFDPQFSSNDYGEKEPSVSVCWTRRSAMPLKMQFALIPISSDEDERAQIA